MKIYITHYDKLTERKKHILEQLSRFNLECEFVSNYGKENLTNKVKSMFRNLSDSEISISMHHLECYRRIVNNNDEYAIIFEDDVILHNDFKNMIEKYINDLPEDWDMLFFGEGSGVHIPKSRISDECNIYVKSTDLINKNKDGINGSTRCADSYLISKKCCQKILEKINKPGYIISMPFDHLLNYINFYNKFNIYWAEPTLTTQGTGNGTFKSSIHHTQ